MVNNIWQVTLKLHLKYVLPFRPELWRPTFWSVIFSLMKSEGKIICCKFNVCLWNICGIPYPAFSGLDPARISTCFHTIILLSLASVPCVFCHVGSIIPTVVFSVIKRKSPLPFFVSGRAGRIQSNDQDCSKMQSLLTLAFLMLSLFIRSHFLN